MAFTIEEARAELGKRHKRVLVEAPGNCWLVEGAKEPPMISPGGLYPEPPMRFVRWLGWVAGKWPKKQLNSYDRIYPNVCKNHLCVNPEHWGLKQPKPKNYRSRKGRKPRTRVIHDDEIYQIHHMREKGATYSEIAEKFMISTSTVGQIVNELGSYADFWERWHGR